MIVVKYSLFAIISIILNILFQYLSFIIYVGFGSLYIAMFTGTLAGLVSKYVLDKKYIFYYAPKNKRDDAKKFVFYTSTGVFTTAIFWVTEIGFDVFFESKNAKYMGAVIGLGIGYVIKYFFDKKYVFAESVS